MSVLEAFVHDPLVEWTKVGRTVGIHSDRQKSSKSDTQIRSSADRNLRPIRAKLRGMINEGNVVSVPNQVDALIKEATSTTCLVGS